MQRMGGINDVILSSDEQYSISVGQEKRLTYWDNRSMEPVHQLFLDGENDEGHCIARLVFYCTILFYTLLYFISLFITTIVYDEYNL